MGLSTALYSGVSGLDASSTELSVIGNDLSNSNTVGYKGGVASFANILSSSLSGGSQVGRGVELTGVSTDFAQGTLNSTDNPLDLAITGDGFFVVKSSQGAQYYTRAGQFSLDKNGNVVDPNGDILQGYLTLSGGGQLGNINVASLSSAPKETSSVQITAQLNSAQDVVNGLFNSDPTTSSGTDFTIDSSNNQVVVNNATVTIPSGTYTGAGLASALQTQLDSISQTALVTYNTTNSATNPIYTFTISDNSGNLTLGPSDDQLSFTYNGTNYTADLGLTANTSYTPAALATAIQSAMNTAAKSDPSEPVADNDITCAFSAVTNEFTFGSTSGKLTNLNWGNSSTTMIPEQIGFTSSSSSLTGSAVVTAPMAIDWANPSTTAANMFGFASTSGISITSGNNVISLTDANNNAGNPSLVTIPAGSYQDGAALATALNTALNAADKNITATYNASTNKISIVADAAAGAVKVDWNGSGTAGATAVDQQFGFSTSGNPTPYESDIAAGGGTVTATYAPTSTGISSTGSSTSNFAVAGLDPNNASTTSDFSTSLTVYDSLGNSHLVNVYFKKVAQSTDLLNPVGTNTTGNRWMYWAVTPSTDSVNGNATISAQGMLEFNTAGALVFDDGGNTEYSSFNFTGGVNQNQSISFNLGQAIAQSGSGLSGTTQFGSGNSVSFQNQDGYSAGTLESLAVDQNGTMTGTFTNGQTENVANVALARFISEDNLSQEGGNLYGESSSSGDAIIGTAGTSGRGTISSSSLEASNVDMATEFVQMISAQQAYQGDTKVISAVNALLTALQQSITT